MHFLRYFKDVLCLFKREFSIGYLYMIGAVGLGESLNGMSLKFLGNLLDTIKRGEILNGNLSTPQTEKALLFTSHYLLYLFAIILLRKCHNLLLNLLFNKGEQR